MNIDSANQDGDRRTITVFLLDDHEIVRRGVCELVDTEPDLKVVGQAGTAVEAIKVVDHLRPDVAVLDIRLEDGNGIEVCREIRSSYPEVACLMLTSFDDDRALVDVSLAGAAGYVLKQIRGNELVATIRKVADGATLLDTVTVRMAMQRLKGSDQGLILSLTSQERKIFELIGEGYSNRQIAAEMFLAEKTVKNYVSNMLAKLGMSRRTEAAAYAAKLEERERLRYE